MPDAAPFWWAVPLVGAIGAAVAAASVLANRRLARMRATLDLIERTESSEHYLKLRSSFRRLDANSGSADFFARITAPSDEPDKALRREIVAYLNHYELVAIGCSQGILDERFYSRWMRSHLVRDWHTAKELIFAARTSRAGPVPSAYVEFEAMARRLETAPEAKSRLAMFKGRLRRYYRPPSPAAPADRTPSHPASPPAAPG